jgi:hypothetical protein
LSFVGAANATDLIVNGSFETPSDGSGNFGGHCGDFSGNLCTGGASTCTGPLGWQSFAQYNFSQAYYAGPAIPASENPGNYYSFRQAAGWSEWGHFTTPMNPATFLSLTMPQYAASETVALTDAVSASDIDAGLGQYTFSAWLASYTEYPEQPYMALQFFSTPSGKPNPADFLGTAAIFDRTTSYPYAVAFANTNNWYDPGSGTNIPLDLSADHQWIKYLAAGTIPVGARQATVFISRSPNASTGGTDAGGSPSAQTYVDLVKLDVTGATPIQPAIVTPPASQIAAVGNSVGFTVTASGAPLTYQWRQNGVNLAGGTNSALAFPSVQAANAGSYDIVVTNSAGAITSTPPAVLTILNPLVLVSGQWDFLSGNLAASYGADLQYNDPGVSGTTDFGTTASYGISNITSGVVTPVMHFTPPSAQWGGYKMYHGAAPNGGGTNVNQYTLIYDVYYPAGSDGTWRSLLQTDVGNTSDGDLFVNPANGIGISGIYDGVVSAEAWHRLAFAIDLTGTDTGTATTPVIAKFIDGVKVGNQTTGLDAGKDGRWSLGPYALLFADNDGDVAEAYVSSVQFSNGRRADAYIEALGGPTALKIPGVIKAGVSNGAVTIGWTGGVALESADSPQGTWSTVPNTAGHYTFTPSPLSTAKFYRPKIF